MSNEDTTDRRISINSNPASTLHYEHVSQKMTIDISAFLSMLDREGVTVTGGESVDTLPIAIVGKTYSYGYQITDKETFMATVKFSKNGYRPSVDSIEIKPFRVYGTGNPKGYMVVGNKQIRIEQGDALLNKCNSILLAGLSKASMDAQNNFDRFIDSLAGTSASE